MWAANLNRGVYRIELSPDLTEATKYTYFKSLNDSVGTINYVMKIRGRIALADENGLYTYDDIHHRIIPYTQLNNALIDRQGIHASTEVNNSSFWLASKNGYTLMTYKDDKFAPIQYIPIDFFGMQNNESNGKVFIFGNTAYFNMNNSVARYQAVDTPSKWNIPQLLVSAVSYRTKDDAVHMLPIAASGQVPKTESNISFQFSFPNYNKETVSYKFTLSGASDLVLTKDVPEITYNNLNYGDYRLLAQAIDARGTVIGETTYPFSIPRPFYLSVWAIILYGLLIAGGVYALARWRTTRILNIRRKEYEAERNKQNIRILEQEKLIAQQQQQLLQTELSTKSKELASLALDVYAKEKVIESLKESMYNQKLKGSISQKDVDNLLKKIENDTGNLEFWNIYQKNFDLIHDHFFRNLRERYPSLTASDLKFCALLRLNLSTKDIAKFTNLTVRGVEAARYRLRKKLNLPEKASLIEFLIDFK